MVSFFAQAFTQEQIKKKYCHLKGDWAAKWLARSTPNEMRRFIVHKYYFFCFNPFTPKISKVILLTVCHTGLVMLAWRIYRRLYYVI